MSDSPRRRHPTPSTSRGLASAFDAVRFTPDRILNLRASLPTAADAAYRAESWLRERQAADAGDVLIITGQGHGSPDGIPVVRAAVVRLFPSLRRAGVIAAVQEHNPGSFVVRLASLQALVNAPRRGIRAAPDPPCDPDALRGLDAETVGLLRRLAVVALSAYGVHSPTDTFVADEMARHFSRLARAVPAGEDPEAALRPLLARALEEYDA